MGGEQILPQRELQVDQLFCPLGGTQCFLQERKAGGVLVVRMLELVLGPCSLVRKGTAILQQINYSDRHQWVSCYITAAHLEKAPRLAIKSSQGRAMT